MITILMPSTDKSWLAKTRCPYHVRHIKEAINLKQYSVSTLNGVQLLNHYSD